MKDLILKENDLIIILKNQNGTCRITKEIPDGRLVILQIVNPKNNSGLVKWLRKKSENSRTIKIIHALDTARRVGGHAFRSAMRKK